MNGEKQKVALTSVIAAVFLTLIKVIVGIFTGSLGILSEAAHSCLDLLAAAVTFFAVRVSDKPADTEHNYGHGKVESFSALIETALLLITCAWIIYEAVKSFIGGPKELEITDATWGVGILILSIIINISRARILRKAAQKYGSQALEADALHFDTDVWSSVVVIAGLICVGFGDFFKLPALKYGDPIAALGVCVLVVIVSIQLGKRTIDVLLDTAPKGVVSDILHLVNGTKGVLDVANVRVRPSGPNYFIDLNVGIGRNESHRVVHLIVHEIREKIIKSYPNSDVVISTFPVDVAANEDREVYHTVKKIVDNFPICTNIHNINVYEVNGKKQIAVHIEVKESMSLKESHDLSHKIGGMIQDEMQDIEDVSVKFEYAMQKYIIAEDVTSQNQKLIDEICSLINVAPERLSCHDVKICKEGEYLTVFLHCETEGDYSIEKTELISHNISEKIRKNIHSVKDIHVHLEPIEERA
ncbi:MAG TPA: cation diffusion facilitator family transporter [Clostridia bacterium]|nr:cation diffusion facilitator family transporter [Clostridia bacterium]